MFVVGKKYTNKFDVHECLATHLFRQGEVAGVMKFIPTNFKSTDMGDIPSIEVWSDEWKEYHEPVVNKFVRHITVSDCYDGLDLEVWRDIKNVSLDYEDIHVGAVEFTVTDGKLTDVRIVERLFK